MTTNKFLLQALHDHGNVGNIGNAWYICMRNGLRGDKNQFAQVVAEYERVTQKKLEPTRKHKRRQKNKAVEVQAAKMSASEVKGHIDRINAADTLFWACWNLFKDGVLWQDELTKTDFSVFFSNEGRQRVITQRVKEVQDRMKTMSGRA